MSAVRDMVFGCLLVTSRLDAEGYAYHGKSRAHIVAWTRRHGPVPAGLELDHLCRERACSEPLHLEAVTRAEQERRKAWAWRMRRTLCPRGHSMTGAAITRSKGRICRTCLNEILASAREGATT